MIGELMIKRIFAAMVFFWAGVATARPVNVIPPTDWTSVLKRNPDRQFASGCVGNSCAIFSFRRSALYQRLEVIVRTGDAAPLLANIKAAGIDVAEQIVFYQVDPNEYNHIMVAADPRPIPNDLPPTDPKIGYKLVYYVGGGLASCTASIIDIVRSGLTGNILGLVGTCVGTIQSCQDFKESWDAERAYWTALEAKNKSEGSGPSTPKGDAQGPSPGRAGNGSPGPSSMDATKNPGMGGTVPCPHCTVRDEKPKHEM